MHDTKKNSYLVLMYVRSSFNWCLLDRAHQFAGRVEHFSYKKMWILKRLLINRLLAPLCYFLPGKMSSYLGISWHKMYTIFSLAKNSHRLIINWHFLTSCVQKQKFSIKTAAKMYCMSAEMSARDIFAFATVLFEEY